MNPILKDEHVRDYVNTIQYLFGEWGWLVLTLFLALMFRGLIHQLVAGITWKFGRRYNETDVVVVNGYYCRISRIGFFFCEFYVYDTINEPPKQGWTWMVANDKLQELNIWKPLSKHEGVNGTIQNIGN